MPIWATRCWVFSLGVPARASPATSPFTSAMNTGTPRREKPSAITISDTVLPVPVAPATSPWRLPYLARSETGGSPLPRSIWATPGALFEAQRVAREDLFRAHRAWQDLLVPGELDDRLECLSVSGHAVRERVVAHAAPALGERLGVA